MKILEILATSWKTRRNRLSDEELYIWAKTEYKKDWRYAYNHMLAHNGAAPPSRYGAYDK